MIKKSFLIIFFLLCANKVSAANLSISVPANLSVGDMFTVVVFADTDGVAINSGRVSLSFPENLVRFSGWEEKGSMLRYWVTTPEEKNGEILFEGVIPGGISGVYDPRHEGLAPIPLARLTFQAIAQGRGEFDILESLILKNDGEGSTLTHTKENGTVNVRRGVGNLNTSQWDKNPPLPIELKIVEGSLFSRTPTLLLFTTTDENSGVKSYEIKIGSGSFREAHSPEAVPRGLFSKTVIVRAYDFSGNFQEASVVLPGLISTKFLVILGLAILGFLGWKMIKLRT